MSFPEYILAPMEGLTDPDMRDVLTRISRYDWCVTEFLRVTDRPHPEKTLFEHCPELYQGSRTASGVPVHVQLLGSEPLPMAETARRLAALDVAGIDINFGCPAKTVNRHRGGAALLEEVVLMHEIVGRIREAVPTRIPVSAKIRLGIVDCEPLLRNAEALRRAGASWLTVHARTRAQGYRPPVDWPAIAMVVASQPGWKVIANGDIDSTEKADHCMAVTGSRSLMLGRAAVSQPDLVSTLQGDRAVRLAWPEVCRWQRQFLVQMRGQEQGIVGRYKQWLGMTTACYPEAIQLFEQIKRVCRRDEMLAIIDAQSSFGGEVADCHLALWRE